MHEVAEILGGDQAVALAYATPASGAVVVPLTNFGVFDPHAGTVTVNSSIAAWRKLYRIRRNPGVALAFHTREHGFCSRPEYVLVQGRAELSPLEDRHGWFDAYGGNWERFAGEPRHPGRLWEWWMSAFYWRVNVTVHAERVTVWPDLACAGTPVIHGAEPPARFPSRQRAPRLGTGPRIAHERAARLAGRLPNRLLGWIDADGLPYVLPVDVAGTDLDGILLRPPAGLVPPGARRAGLTAHWFSRHVVGQNQRVHTGWLEARPGAETVRYAPHTTAAYRFPASRRLFRLVAGLETRRRLPAARRALLDSEK
jgi:hypothetical protein